MEILRGTLGLAPDRYRLEPRLLELTFGSWEGLTWREVRRLDPARAAIRERDKWNFVPPDGESYAMLATRVRPLLDGITGPTLLVAHGGVARVLLHLLGHVPPTAAPRVDIWQGRLLVFDEAGYRWD